MRYLLIITLLIFASCKKQTIQPSTPQDERFGTWVRNDMDTLRVTKDTLYFGWSQKFKVEFISSSEAILHHAIKEKYSIFVYDKVLNYAPASSNSYAKYRRLK